MAKGYREYIADLVKWTSFELEDEMEEAKAEFFGSDEEAEIYEHDDLAQTLFELWFILRRPCNASGMTPLDIFISETRDILPKKERKIYKGFRDNILGFFKVVEIGPLIKLRDLSTRNEYSIFQPQGTWEELSRGEEVAEESEASPLELGGCIAGSLLPFEDFWVLTGASVVFSEQTSYLIERRFRRQRDIIEVSYRDIFQFLSEPPLEEEERLDSVRERISSILAECDIASKFTVENLEKRLKKTSPEKLPQAMGKILTDLGIPSEDINRELIGLLSKLHDLLKGGKEVGLLSKLRGLVKGKKEESATGPWEKAFIKDLFDYLQLKIHPDSYPDPKQLQKAVDKAEEEWLNTSQEELADRTPREVIREERRKLDHPHPDEISYKASLMPIEFKLPIHAEEERIIEEYHRAFGEHRKGDFNQAIEIYESILPQFEERPDSFRLLGNLGACYALIGQKEKGLEYLRKALEINPDYEFAKLNIQKMEEMSPEELTLMGIARKRFVEGLEKLWSFEKIEKMSTREIEKKMKKLVPVFDLKKFVDKTENYFSYIDLCEEEYEPFSVAEGYDEDFAWRACGVLWQRLLPDRPTVEHFDAELDEKLGELLETKDEERDKEVVKLSLEILGLIKSRFISETPEGYKLKDGFYQRYQEEDMIYELDSVAKDMLFNLHNERRHEERIEWAEVLYEAFRDDDFLQHKADSFIALGEEEEGERTYQEILERNPENFWYHVHAGDAFSIPQRKDPKQARKYYLQALEIAKAQTGSNEALENLEIACERLLNLAEGTGNKSETSYYRKELSGLRGSSLPVSSSLLEPRSPAKQKVGRNDPCPCGSGKKYKKCCGSEL